jgi:flagellar basal-body rod protein FlgB
MESLFGKTFNLLSTLLDYRSERNKLITTNITNIDTEDFKPTDYIFKDDLSKAMNIRVQMTRTNEKHFPNAGGEITRNDFKTVKSEERVDLDTEMANLAENQLMYNLSAEMLARKFRNIKDVLSEAK